MRDRPLLIEKGKTIIIRHPDPRQRASQDIRRRSHPADPAQHPALPDTTRTRTNHSRHRRRSAREFGWFEFHLVARSTAPSSAKKGAKRAKITKMAKIPRCQPTNTNASLPWVADRPQKHGRRPALPPTPSRRKKGLAVPRETLPVALLSFSSVDHAC